VREPVDEGLTLLELLIVVALISIIAAFAVPRLLRARMAANEASAIASLKAVAIAEDLFAKFCGSGGYAVSLMTLGQLPPGGGAPFIPPDLSVSDTPQKAGYNFTLTVGAGSTGAAPDCHGNATQTRFYGSAVPATPGVSGRRAFALGTNHTIWQLAGGAAPTEPFGSPATPIQ
jgi:type IV pilus assembly protein PilA